MKKLIIKTTVITVASIIGAILLTYLTFLAFFPGKLARFYDKVGFERQAVKQMVREHHKTGDLQDLITLCEYCDKYGNNWLIAQYFGDLVTKQEFIDYTEAIENGSEFYDFCAGKYVVALYETGKDERFVVDTAFAVTRAYVEYNPVHALISVALERESVDGTTLTFIVDGLTNLLTTASSQEVALINSDIEFITGVLTQ